MAALVQVICKIQVKKFILLKLHFSKKILEILKNRKKKDAAVLPTLFFREVTGNTHFFLTRPYDWSFMVG